jgi:hypothetical protein
MADKSPLGYLPETSPEAMEANRAYQEALARLNESLDMRKNRIIDPRWAAAAQGFFAPTRTGGWGEALGNVIGNVSKADEAMALEGQNIAKNQLDVAAQGIQLQKQKENERTYRQMMGLEPLAGALPSAAPAGTSGGALPGPAGPQGGQAPAGGAAAPRQFGIQIAPPQSGLTRNQFLAGAQVSGVSPHEALKQWDEIERKNREPKEGGIFDIRSGMFFPAPGAGTEERQVPLPDGSTGTIKFPKYIANILDDAVIRGDSETFNNIIRQFINYGRGISVAPQGAGPNNATPNVADSSGVAPSIATVPSAVTATPPAGIPSAIASTAPQRIQTVEEQQAEQRRRDVEKSAREEEAKGIAKGSVEYFDKAGVAADQSQALFSAAENMISIINAQPDAFRLLSKPGIANAVLRAAEEGIKIGNLGSISLPSSMLTQYKLNQKQLDALNLYANQLAIAKSANRQMVRVPGEGTTSDLETNMANAVLTMTNASPEALKFINEFTLMRARNAELRFEKLNELRQKGMSLADARASQEMRDIRNGYESALRGLAQRNAQFLSAAKKPPKSAPKTEQKPPSENSRRLDEALRD